MGLTGMLREVSFKTCPHCTKEYGKHSKKGFMKCLYTANMDLYELKVENTKLKQEKIKVKDGQFEVNTPEGVQILNIPEGVSIEEVPKERPEFVEPNNPVQMIKDKKDFKGGEIIDE